MQYETSSPYVSRLHDECVAKARDRVLLYTRGLNIDPLLALELAVESLRRGGIGHGDADVTNKKTPALSSDDATGESGGAAEWGVPVISPTGAGKPETAALPAGFPEAFPVDSSAMDKASAGDPVAYAGGGPECREGEDSDMANVMDGLHALLRERDILLGVTDTMGEPLRSVPPLNRSTMVAEAMDRSLLRRALRQFGRLAHPSRNSLQTL